MEDLTRESLSVEGSVPFAQVPQWLARHPELSPSAKALYLDIMTYADNKERTAFPSRETLGKDLGVSVRSIGRYMKELEGVGAITVIRRRNKKTGNFYANHYRLRFNEPVLAQNHGLEPEDTSVTRREDTSGTRTTTNLTKPTSSIAFDHKIEPKPLSPSPSGDGHTLSEQLGINEQVKSYLIDIVLAIYSSGERFWSDDNHWVTLEAAFEEYLDLEAGDAIANRGWDARLEKVIRDNLHVGERYAASVYLGMLHNYVRSH